MQTRINGKLTIREGRLTLKDGLRIGADSEVDIRAGGEIFTYETTSEGMLNGSGKIYVHILFKHVQGNKSEVINIIYYGERPFFIREIQIMRGSVVLAKEQTVTNEYDITP
jgi:hypothetical protein